MIFALYESWITKVVWTGYMDSTGPQLGTFLGIAISEFSILTFFWHPIMSFILPVLVFEILARKTIKGHEKILRKTTNKSTVIILFLILISTFIANGNQFNIISSNASLIGTLIIVFGLYHLSKNANLKEFEFKKISFIII
jgi:peptidoglycan/LPS O-acetylase OafA/YrhL